MKRAVTILLFIFPLLAWSQSASIATAFKSNFKKAEELYGHLAYRNALEIYLHVVDRDPENYVAQQRVADCYFRLGNIGAAEEWYAKLARTESIDPIYKYQYAQVLSIQGKYAQAQKWFGEYLNSGASDERAKSKYDFIYYLSYYYRDSVLYDIENMPFNSDQSDFGAQYHEDGIIFVSARDKELFVKRRALSAVNDKEAMLNIFLAPSSPGSLEDESVPYYKNSLNSPYHDGPVTFFDQGRQVAFTRNNLNEGKPVASRSGKIHVKLHFGSVSEQKLTNIQSFQYNDDSYSTGHAWVSEDGNLLYFSSDMPGGMGGADIYRCEKQDGKWSQPHNLGPTVNTMGDEFFPYQQNDTTMYFASNGHGGLGGLDIYLTHQRAGVFMQPENLGYPLNTSKDDFALVMDSAGRRGMFSSNRDGGVGYDDIYQFNVKSFFVVGRVVDRTDSTLEVPLAHVQVMDHDWNVIETVRADDRGHFQVDLPFDREFNFSASKDGYSWIDSLHYSTQVRTLGRDSVVMALWRHSMFALGSVYSNETQSQLKGVSVKLHNLTDGTIDSVATDSTGRYRFLIEPNKVYQIQAGKDGFLPHGFELNTAGILDGNLVNDILLEEEFEKKLVLLFEHDRSELRRSDFGELDAIVKTLKRIPKASVNVGAHADATGKHDYNRSLSERRAAAAVDYFIAHGVDRSRIEAIGFGEELLLNECSNGVNCSADEHSRNRRVEIKVQRKHIE